MGDNDRDSTTGRWTDDPARVRSAIVEPSKIDGQRADRPGGVTLIALLAGITGVVMILVGAIAIPAVPIPGAVCLGVGVAELAFTYGAWVLKPWAWPLGIALQIVLSILDLIAVGMDAAGSIVVSGIIVYYLYRRHVKEAFGR
jgi:hypothetical protein